MRTKLSTRSKARKAALDILFVADLRQSDPTELLAEQLTQGQEVRPFTQEIVAGVWEHREQLDQLISDHLSGGWSLARMPRVDRVAARIAVWEMLHTTTDNPVAVAEAVAMVEDLSTDESPAFINGVLRHLDQSVRESSADGSGQSDEQPEA